MKDWIERKTGITWGRIAIPADKDYRVFIRLGCGGWGLAGFEAIIAGRGFYVGWGVK